MATYLVDQHCAAEAPPAGLLQGSKGTVVADDHHLHRDTLSAGLLTGQAKVEPVPSVVLHNEEGAHCRVARAHQGLPTLALWARLEELHAS